MLRCDALAAHTATSHSAPPDQRTVVITGASSGIGAATALLLANKVCIIGSAPFSMTSVGGVTWLMHQLPTYIS